MAYFWCGSASTIQKVFNALFGFILILSSVYSGILDGLGPEIPLLGLLLASVIQPVVVIFREKHLYFYFKYNQDYAFKSQ